MNTYKWIKQLALIATCATLVACEERILVPQAFTTLVRNDERASGACAFTFDRSGVGVISLTTPDSAGRILAGYTTNFARGKPPFACDRLKQTIEQGVFQFNVTSLQGSVPEPYRGAFLEIIGFTPVGRGIEIISAQPWDAQLWETSPVPRYTCQFKVFRANQPWTPGDLGWGGSAISAVELATTARKTFNAPVLSTFAVDVTHEVGQWLRRETPELGFVIMPADNSINFKASNSCVGLFSVRLRAYFGEDD